LAQGPPARSSVTPFQRPRPTLAATMADEGVEVKGTGELLKQAAAGMALFKTEAEAEGDVDAAKAYKDEMDAKFAALEAEAAALTGKDNKKARSEKSKEASEIKKTKEYIDAEKICKGLPPKFGNFLKAGSAPVEKKEAAPAAAAPAQDAPEAADKKDDKKKDSKKKAESAGISPDERKELEKLKTDIIAKKASLKETGMSGGQINKDADIVAMVARMNELKEKESPGSTTAGKDDKKKEGGGKKKLNSDAAKEVEQLEKDIEEYKNKLTSEFGYSKKEVQADPDFAEMNAKLKALKK